ncbi:glycogen debranching N-terminal domain-containing protein [Brasilonema octagenarum]|uniref:Putative glycogen debranching enzyme N-terminal domain-containing protein n=1 Tax=Brasilonema octagenarum UFV-OR1 TaxID=417115 RepID=A0ABX1M6Y5_9CYAN|nr:glycogen debranching N-terminal domain-containing protein [Brasilonema octagenarum]NMF64298.1 hypothetical protein [Brasilonema octagenarum UFV-OR1]
MPTKVIVNPGQIAINDGSTFLVTASDGSIDDNLAQGFFVRDTRLISYYEVSLNRQPLQLLASSPLQHHCALYQFTNRETPTIDGTLPSGCLLVTIRRDIAVGMHEDIDITSHYTQTVELKLMLAIRSDFADIFQVKSQHLLPRGAIATTWKDGILTTEYRNAEFYRGLQITPTCANSTPYYANGRLMFDIKLEPGQTWHSCVDFTALADGDVLQPQQTCTISHDTEAARVRDDFVQSATQLQSSNAEIAAYYRQSLIDFGALRIKVEDRGQHFWMPAAGIPWFVAVFGRDAIVPSLQTIMVYPEFVRGTLIKLAQLQATTVDDWRDAQPGRMLHEIRRGELAQLHEIPHTPYYGTIDTTILFLSDRIDPATARNSNGLENISCLNLLN